MKKLLLTATATLVCFGVFAQGKLAFQNASDQLVYFTTDKSKMATGDANKTVGGFALAGSGLYTGAGGTIASLAGTPSLVAGLWAGSTAGNMVRVTTTTFGNVDFSGLLTSRDTILPGLVAGVPAFFQLQVYDSRVNSAAEAWAQLDMYGGQSAVFQATPQASVYSPMWVTAAPVSSTMPKGTQLVNDYTGFPG